MNQRIIRTLLLSEGFFLMAGGLLGPIWAVFVEDIGGDILDASGAFAAFMLTAAVVTYLLGKIEDHQRYKAKFVVLGYLMGALGFTGYLFANNTLTLLGVQAILGITVAIKDPAYDGLYSKFAKRHLTLAWGEWEAMDYLTSAIAAVVGGLIAKFFGFLTLIYLMIILSLLGLLASLSLLHLNRKKR